jgi:hypothetical protein
MPLFTALSTTRAPALTTGLSLDVRLFCFAQRRKDTKKLFCSRKAAFSIIAAWQRSVAKKPLRGRHDIFVSLRLCAKPKIATSGP